MVSALESFLQRNSVVPSSTLLLVHSTKSYNLKAILAAKEIKPQECDVFLNEKLNYFFVGRPSYKYTTSSTDASFWELPCCFIFASDVVSSPQRTFPFDSGAFSKKLFPDYIAMMQRKDFEISGEDAPQRIIGSFFGSAKNYFLLKPKSAQAFDQEFSLSPFDAEVQAILRLAGEGAIPGFDDRRFAIEVQSKESLRLADSKPLAVVLPEQYLDIPEVIDTIQNDWGAEPLGYPMFSLSVSAYHALIYKEVYSFYKRNKFI